MRIRCKYCGRFHVELKVYEKAELKWKCRQCKKENQILVTVDKYFKNQSVFLFFVIKFRKMNYEERIRVSYGEI